MKNFNWANKGYYLLYVLGVFISINILSQKFFFRKDFTDTHVYSISKGSVNIVKNLTQKVTARLYFSSSLKDLPVIAKNYASRVEEVLREYTNITDKLVVEKVDPAPDTDDEEWAKKSGITPVRLNTNTEMYLGVVLSSEDKEIAIPYLDPTREEFLEYDLSEAFVNLFKTTKPKIGILSSLEVFPAREGDYRDHTWSFVKSLETSFKTEKVDEKTKEIADDIKTLMVFHPKSLEDETLYAIDQFVMRGGRLFVAVDPFSRADAAVAFKNNPTGGSNPNFSSDLKKLFSAWQIHFASDMIAGDSTSATSINTGFGPFNYPYFLTLHNGQISTASPITAQLHNIVLGEASYFETVAQDSPYTLEPLLTTSEQGGTVSSSEITRTKPDELAHKFSTDGKKRNLAALLKGKFKSAFTEKPKDAPEGHKHLAQCEEDNLIFLIGDADFLQDSNSIDKMMLGNQLIIRPKNDNVNVLLNALEFLSGNLDLISIRSSGRISRPYGRVLALEQEAQKKWQSEEEKLSSQLSELQSKLGELQSQRTDANKAMLSMEQQTQIKKFHDEESKIRTRLREVKKNLRVDIESLGHRIVALNLFLIPFLLVLLGFGVFWQRENRARKEK